MKLVLNEDYEKSVYICYVDILFCETSKLIMKCLFLWIVHMENM